MIIYQTTKTTWEINEGLFVEHAKPEYEEWIEDGGIRGDYFRFVQASVAELGTELYGLQLVDTDTRFAFGYYGEKDATV